MLKKNFTKHYRTERPLNARCPFCVGKTRPDYKEIESLRRLISDRGKILARGRSGVCSLHQRRLALAVKRARHLALLPFVNRF